jgi:hypothetical protein
MAKRDELKEKYESKIGKRMFTYFSMMDSSKTTKYLQYYCMMWEHRKEVGGGFTSAKLVKTVEEFEQFISFIDDKDLYNKKYLDWDTLSKTVENAIQAKLDSEFNRNEHIRVLYEDANYLFLEPITHIGSQKYGANTRWCTTMRNESGTFKRYVNNGYLAYLIKKNSPSKGTNYGKIAFYTEESQNPLGCEIQIYNQNDNTVSDLVLSKNDWSYDDLTRFTFLFRMEALKKFQMKRAKSNVESTIQQIKTLDLETLKKDLEIISGKTTYGDDTFNRLESVMKIMIEKIENY